MYFQPYGDEQQLNLNWIINEIINLHKQLDPDYETPSFTQIYPYSNLNRLNLDWILSELKALKELAPEPTPAIDIQAVAEALVALPFDSNTSYQIYDFISKDGEIWRATEAIPAGGEWDSTKWFKTKLGTDLAVLERWINTINNSLTSEIQARQDADTALQNRIDGLTSANITDDSDAGGANVKASLNALKGSLDTLYVSEINPDNWELGRIFIENDHVWDYYNDDKRIRTKYGFYYSFPKGTKFGLTDNTNYRYAVGYRKDGIYYGTRWLKQNYILPTDAEVVICASRDPETAETNINDILSKLIIETPPEYQINELKGSLNSLDSADTAIQGAIASVETNWQSASRTFAVGEYIYSTTYGGLYKITTAVPQGTSFEGHVTLTTIGDVLSSELINISENITLTIQNVSHTLFCRRWGKNVWLNIFTGTPQTLTEESGWVSVGTLSPNYCPPTSLLITTKFNDTTVQIRIETNGAISFAGIPAITNAYVVFSINYIVN